MITADWEEFTKLSHSEWLAFHHRKPGEGGTRSFRSTIVFNPFRCFRFNNHASEALACDALHNHMGFFLLAAMVLAKIRWNLWWHPQGRVTGILREGSRLEETFPLT